MTYDADDLRVFGVIFGPKGTELALHVQPVASDKDLTNIPTEEGEEASIEHTEEGWTDPYVRIHEFAHLYCAKYHAEALKTQDNVIREEACAILAEYMTAIASSDNLGKYWLARRLPIVHPMVMALVCSILHGVRDEELSTGPVYTSDYFTDILAGKYG